MFAGNKFNRKKTGTEVKEVDSLSSYLSSAFQHV